MKQLPVARQNARAAATQTGASARFAIEPSSTPSGCADRPSALLPGPRVFGPLLIIVAAKLYGKLTVGITTPTGRPCKRYSRLYAQIAHRIAQPRPPSPIGPFRRAS